MEVLWWTLGGHYYNGGDMEKITISGKNYKVHKKKRKRWIKQGYLAGYLGHDEDVNPYRLDSEAGQLWIIGHNNGAFWRENWEEL